MNCRFIQPTPQPAHIGGGREIWELVGNGPTAYSQTTGDLLSGPGNGEYFSVPFGGFLTPDGIYELCPFSTAVGTTGSLRLKWGFRWYFALSNGFSGVGRVAATGGSGMTPGTYAIAFSGGGGSGATGTVTVLTATTYTVAVTNPGSGYTSAPTATVATGGTPPTLTPALAVVGQEAPNGANLSAEYVQFGAIGGQM